MGLELEKALNRMQARREAAQRALTAGAGVPPALDARPGALFPIGSRVFDTVSGEEGVIVGRTQQNFVVPAPNRRDR